MKDLKNILINDLKNFVTYRILHFVIILSILLAVTMGFFPNVDALNYIYISVFILPVIIFAISLYIEHNEDKLLPEVDKDCNPLLVVFGKVLSALLLSLIPMILYIFILTLVLNIVMNVLLFILVYLMATLIHIVIGLSLAIISKSNFILSINYLAYIILFSVVPFFYSQGLIPRFFQYVMLISPAYLSGLLFENVIYGVSFASALLPTLAVVLQIVYIALLCYFVIRPYFKSYLLSIK